MTSTSLSEHITTALQDAKALDIQVLDVSKLTNTTDTMIICSGSSGRHVAAVAKQVQLHLSEQGVLPLGTEGEDTLEWILLDYVDAVVHVMRSQTREYYDLESLWDERLTNNSEKSAATAAG